MMIFQGCPIFCVWLSRFTQRENWAGRVGGFENVDHVN